LGINAIQFPENRLEDDFLRAKKICLQNIMLERLTGKKIIRKTLKILTAKKIFSKTTPSSNNQQKKIRSQNIMLEKILMATKIRPQKIMLKN